MTNWHPDDVIDMDDPSAPGERIKSKEQALRILDMMLDEIPSSSPIKERCQKVRFSIANTSSEEEAANHYVTVDSFQTAFMMFGG